MRRILLLAAVCGVAVAQNHRLTLEDLLAPEAIGESALSPDGKTFAMSRNGQIVLMPSEGGWPVTLTSAAGGKSGLSWSPDGRTIAYASRGGIWTIAVAGGDPRRLTNAVAGPGDPREAGDRAPQWSPKGRWILYESGRRGRNNMMVVSDDGKINSFITEANADEEGATWSPDGSQISYTERTPKFFSGKLNVIKFDPATGAAGGDPVTWYTAPNDRGGGWSIRKAQWSPDGKSLAVVLQESGWDNVYFIAGAGSLAKPITKGEFEDRVFEFSPD